MEFEKRTGLLALFWGEQTLYSDTTPRCENCREPAAHHAMLDRIGAKLKDHPTLPEMRKYCVECRKSMF